MFNKEIRAKRCREITVARPSALRAKKKRCADLLLFGKSQGDALRAGFSSAGAA
jgi:hypothetical protein